MLLSAVCKQPMRMVFPPGIIQNKFLAFGSQAMNAGFTRSRPAIYLHRGMTAVGRDQPT
jgi:hypothetical protein